MSLIKFRHGLCLSFNASIAEKVGLHEAIIYNAWSYLRPSDFSFQNDDLWSASKSISEILNFISEEDCRSALENLIVNEMISEVE